MGRLQAWRAAGLYIAHEFQIGHSQPKSNLPKRAKTHVSGTSFHVAKIRMAQATRVRHCFLRNVKSSASLANSLPQPHNFGFKHRYGSWRNTSTSWSCSEMSV